jgi:hypothetical protein
VTDREQKFVRKAAKKAAARPGPRADKADCEAVDPAAPKVHSLPVLLARGPRLPLYQIVLASNNCLGQNAGLNPTQQQPSFRILGVPFEGGASMHKAISSLGAFLLVAIVLAGCGVGMNSTLPPSGTNMAQVSLTIHDNPPMGVTVLSFEIEVTGATLQSSGSSQPVSLLSEPEDIEIEHLQTESALLASRSVPTGTYSGLMVTFANPRMTIQNQTHSAAHPRNANVLRSTSV